MTKEIQVVVCVNEIAYYNSNDAKKRLATLPLKLQWVIRKNMKELEKYSKEFETFRDELIQKRNHEWFVEGNGKCEKYTEKDENGNDVEMLRVIPDLMEEYSEYERDMNMQLQEILLEKNEVNICPIDLDDFVEKAENTEITMDDIDMISLFEESE